MGVNVTCDGYITVPKHLSTKELYQRYKRKTIDLDGKRVKLVGGSIVPLLEQICNEDEGFDYIDLDERDDVYELHLVRNGTYHQEDVVKTLNRLAPLAEEGYVPFDHDSISYWCFSLEEGKFVEYDGGEVRYECDDPVCKKKCLFNHRGRCFVSDRKTLVIKQNRVIGCGTYVPASIKKRTWGQAKMMPTESEKV